MLPTPRKGNQTPPRIDRGVDRPEESQNAEVLSYPQAGNGEGGPGGGHVGQASLHLGYPRLQSHNLMLD